MSVLEEGLNSHVQSKASVTGLIGDRFYPQLIDFDSDFPAVGYEMPSDEATHSFDGHAGLATAVVTLNCWGKGSNSTSHRSSAVKVREAFRNVFDGYRGNLGDSGVFCNHCKVADKTDVTYQDPENAKLTRHGVQIELRIKYTQPAPTFA